MILHVDVLLHKLFVNISGCGTCVRLLLDRENIQFLQEVSTCAAIVEIYR